MLTHALEYARRGWSVIPVGRDKKPLVKWEPYQDVPASEEAITEWWTKWPDANIGVITGAVSGIVVVDIDSAEGGDAIQEYIPSSTWCPTVATPRGQHLYFKHPGFGVSNNTKVIPGCDFRGDGGYVIVPPSARGAQKYEWILGLDEAPLQVPPNTYMSTLNRALQSVTRTPNRPNSVTDSVTGVTDPPKTLTSVTQNGPKALHRVTERYITLQEGQRDEDLFYIAGKLARARMSEENITTVMRILAGACNPPFSEKDADEKAMSAIRRARSRDRDFSVEIREWAAITEGFFSIRTLQDQLEMDTPEQKGKLRVIMHRLVKEGYLERMSNRDGMFRRVAPKSEAVEFKKVTFNPVAIKWPFQLETWVHTLPKSVIVVSGTPDAGKTAFLLNFVKLNQENFRIHYFTSEMGAMEMNSRLSLFNDIRVDDWDFDLREKADHFSDEIDPAEINVIDFMEITKDHYLVAEKIKQIFDKLTTGVAVIALQKRPGDDLGRGGVASLEKPRLYLSMERGKIKIIKAKNWVDPTHNPNGLTREYRLRRGCEFVCDADWEREYGEDI